MPNFVYVLGSNGKGGPRTYVGWTNDLAARLQAHNSGRGAKSTRGRSWVLLYAEKFASKSDAMKREWHLKRERKTRQMLLSVIQSI
ncbi:MAG: GIY-YIG nuclease family protein [Rhodospirillaceae bacterium]|nr:GIY-YIG nuclease family protein [Rhodospirillaceae bacterium]